MPTQELGASPARKTEPMFEGIHYSSALAEAAEHSLPNYCPYRFTKREVDPTGTGKAKIPYLMVTEDGTLIRIMGNGGSARSIQGARDQRHRIGEIIVDKIAGEFSVAGKILHLKDALEYLAVSTDGMKGNESLLELSTPATEFNRACILIGLDEKNGVKPRYQFDEHKAEGQRVAIAITRQDDGKTMRVSGANAMTVRGDLFDDDSWVYIGSIMSDDGQEFMANMAGALIGFVHDPFSVIDHENGAAIGACGFISGNDAVLPPEGTSISFTVSVVRQ